jgi:excisionase family DNA binding protein
MACKSTTFAFHAPRVTAKVPQIRAQIGVIERSSLSLEPAGHGAIRWPGRASRGLKSCGIHPSDHEAARVSRSLCRLLLGPGEGPRGLRRRAGRSLWRAVHDGGPAMRAGSTSGLDRGLTTAEAARVLGVHVRTVRRYMSLGLLAYRRLPGGRYRIPENAIREFWRANEGAPRPARRRAATSPLSYDTARSERQARSRSPRRRPLGRDTARPYDLSTAALSELRSRFS